MASFGTFIFEFNEEPQWNTDSLWRRRPSYSRKRPLGSGADVIRTMALGSYERSFEVMLTPARFSELLALLNTTAQFVDWNSPTPDSRSAFLAACEPVAMIDNTRTTALQFNRYRIELVSQ